METNAPSARKMQANDQQKANLARDTITLTGSIRAFRTKYLLARDTRLSQREFIAVWMLLLILHGLCGVYLLLMARLYFFMEDNLLMHYFADLLAPPQERHFYFFGTLVGILGGLHGVQLFLHIAWSIRARAPVVWPCDALIRQVTGIFVAAMEKGSKTTDTSTFQSRIWIKRVLYVVDNMLSVQGDHFTLVFVLRNAVEAATQIFQCYEYSTLISRDWITRAYVGMVVANCWTTPLLSHLIIVADSNERSRVATIQSAAAANKASSIRERTLCVAIDTLMTVVSCLVLPLAIFVPWALRFDRALTTFPDDVLYGDTEFTRLVYENQAIFFLSYTDGLSKTVPHVSLIIAMASISSILEQNPLQCVVGTKRVSSSTLATYSFVQKPQKPAAFVVIGSKSARAKLLRRFQEVLALLGFVVAGVAVLILHFSFNRLDDTVGNSTSQVCLHAIHPWFAQNVSCSVVKYNCYRQGVISPPPDALDNLQREVLSSIIFEHCIAFEMPKSIRDFPNLLGIELWNVTLVRWGVDAALNAHLHSKLVFLIMVQVNMTGLPQGVLQTPFPKVLGDIEIVHTNLTSIPEEVMDVWTNVNIVFVEHSPLQEFPTALLNLPLHTLSLVDDGLDKLPDNLFTADAYPSYYDSLMFSYNPLNTLPISVRDDLVIGDLVLAYTGLSTLPSWTEKLDSMTLGGSPFCEEDDDQIPDIVDCLDIEWDPSSGGYYPLNFVESMRQL